MSSRIPSETAEAVATLFRAEASGLFRYACTLPNVNRSDAEDFVQVTFQAAAVGWEQLSVLDPESRRKWLYRVLRNKSIDQWRTYGSRWSSLEQIDKTAGPPQQTDRAALCSLTLEQCWDRIRMMPDVRQRVAFLRWGEDWSSAEIAELMGISQSTVRGHLKVARDELTVVIGSQVPLGDFDDDTDEGWRDDPQEQ